MFSCYVDNFYYWFTYSNTFKYYMLFKGELGSGHWTDVFKNISIKQMKEIVFGNPNIKIR